ncbi:MerR family transcriptional regulator [Brevibacterium marinum]|uniref:DNA-binding transcriptional MerR regulator n=1 Tax=Brevibacterium marinum TaxID=418643 RepID=A0A846S193_9MICO|nr:MerR family transcriptional regulator [Brevibacterium marinum]NJC56743.1 DNA-binding transcriptional MerR regulator [Brevibacterium marinum]
MTEATVMRMAELARRSGVSVPTIKYYMRQGLLQPGRRTSVNQAEYDHRHLDRLRLIRALTSVAGLPLSKVREVVDAVSGESTVIDAMAVTQDVLTGTITDEGAGTSEILDRVISQRGWRCARSSPAYQAAAGAVTQLHAEELTTVLDHLDGYAEAAEMVGRADLEAIEDAESLEQRIRGVVLGSVLRRPLLEALVLLAQQHFAQNVRDSGES